MRKVEKINSQSDYWPTNYRQKFHCSHKTQTKRCIQNLYTVNERWYAKAKRQKIKHSTKKTTIERQKEKKKKKTTATMMMSVKKKPTIRNIEYYRF